MTDNHQPLDIIIVGAGLGGLSAGISCALAGHKITILESTKTLAEVGAGLQITPNGAKLLRRWGLGAALDTASSIPTTITVHRYSDGKVLAHEDNFDANLRQKYTEPFFDIHRADLQKMMYDRCISLGVTIKLNSKVTSITTEPYPQIHLESSPNPLSADLIIGADGLWSRCRDSLLSSPSPPLPTGDLAYRILLPISNITTPSLIPYLRPAVHFWIGPSAHAVAYSMKDNSMYNIVLLCPDNLPEGTSRSAGSISEMRALFAGWDPILTQFLDQVTMVEKWKLMHRAPLDTWSSSDKRFTLLGDACHPMLPYLAQGANSSLEDGAVLGRLLSYVHRREKVGQAVEMYERVRKRRSEAIVRETFAQREAFHLVDGLEQEVRDAVFESVLRAKTVDGRFPSRWTCPEVQPWLYGYDAYEEADNAARLSGGFRVDE